MSLGRYLAMNGEMGDCPDWYMLFKAAKECNCKPWELLEQSIWWKETALKLITAEARAQEILKAHGK